MFSTVQKRLRTKQRRFLQGVKRYIKRVYLFYKRRKYLCLGIATTFFLLILSLLFFSTSRIKPNDDILFLRTYNKAILENRNPTFNVSFGQRNNLEKQWVRFEAKVAKKNPFEEKERNFFSNLLDLVNSRKTLGVELSLKQIGEKEVKTSTELIEVKKLKKEDGTYHPSEKPVVLNPNVVEGVDIEYQILEGLGLKEDIIIRDLKLYTEECEDLTDCNLPFNELIFDLKLDKGVNLKRAWYTDNGGSTETFYFTDNRGNYIGHFLPSWAIDSKGVKTHDVGIKIIDESNSNSKIKVVVNKEWLLDEERVFPVRIDPTIIHDSELDFEEGSFLNTEVRDGPELGLKEVEGSLIDANTIGYWTFDEESGSGAYIMDSSGNNNHGTPVGTTYVKGKIGGARSFNGSSDTIEFGNILNMGLNDFSICFWVKKNTIPDSNQYIVSKAKAAAQNYRYGIRVGVNGGIGAFIQGDGGADVLGQGNISIADGQWHYVTIVFKRDSEVGIYIDGEFDTSANISQWENSNMISDNPFRIGAYTASDNSSPSSFFEGTLDDFRISNMAYTPEEIIISYLNGLEEHSGHYTSPDNIDLGTSADLESISWNSVGINTGDGEIPYSDEGLVAQWNFNEASGTTTVNTGSCGTTCNGTLTNFSNTSGQDVVTSSGWTHTHRKWGGGALMFDGVDDYVSVSNSPIVANNSSITVSVWVKPFATPNGLTRIIARPFGSNAASRSGSIHFTDKGKFTFFIYNTNTDRLTLSSNQVELGKWYYIVGVWDQTSTKAQLYINGILEAEGNIIGPSASGTSTLNFGYSVDSSNVYFQGVIDNASIYSRPLSKEEIMSNYQAGNIEFQYRYTSDSQEEEEQEYVAATGGDVSHSDGYTIHTFTSNGTFEVSGNNLEVELLVVAGGGGAGASGTGDNSASGGGGAGGLIYRSAEQISANSSLSVAIGGGGGGAATISTRGSNGGNSSFGSIIAIGGGGGGSASPLTTPEEVLRNGKDGGSGGGGASIDGFFGGTEYGTGGATTQSGQGGFGNNGAGAGNSPFDGIYAGGGGGANSAALTYSGGSGKSYSISGTSITYAKGGNGGRKEGGSIMGASSPTNRGNGGNGKNAGTNASGDNGTPGIVIVRYPTQYGSGCDDGCDSGWIGGSEEIIAEFISQGDVVATGGTISYSGHQVIHTFTSDGTFKVSNQDLELEILVVGGGGGAGKGTTNTTYNAGGGGAGGLVYRTGVEVSANETIFITVGAGGTGATSAGSRGSNGDTSSFGAIVANGGGGGGSTTSGYRTGSSGGSGGGAARYSSTYSAGGSATQSGEGGYGNNGATSTSGGAGGGGGAGGVGTVTAGGAGRSYSISGNSVTYARGGNAQSNNANGAPNTGNGGNAAATNSANDGGSGGSGIVIVRYLPKQSEYSSNPKILKTSIVAKGVTNNSSFEITDKNLNIDSNTIGYWKLDENNRSSMIPIDSNLVGYWDFIESSGSGAYLLDKSTNTNDATPSGTSYTAGIKEGGRSFNGSSNFITIPHHNSLSFERTDSYTLEAWFKTTTTSNQRLITKMNHGDASLKGYDLNIINGVIRTHLTGTWSSSAIQVDGTTNVTNGQWNHVIVTYNGSSSANGMKIYLNGQLENMSINYNNLSSTTVNTENVVFGKRSGNDTAYFNGTLDEVGIYNRELTALEIEERFNSTKDIIDYSENNNHGYSQGTTYTPGRIEGARSFDGSSDAIMIPHSTSLKPQLPITISAWIKPEVLNTGSFIFRNDRAECSGSGENRYNGIWFNINESNQVNIHYGNGGTCGTASRRTKNSATTLTSPNTWYHVAGVIRGATDMDIYINGQDAGGTYSGTGGALTYTTDRDSYIGARGDNSVFDNYFKGIIDDVQFSNVARTHAEIYELYRMGKDHYINKTLDNNIDLTDSTMLPFWIASDTLGSNLEFTYGNSKYINNQPDANTVGLWRLDEESNPGAYILDSSGNDYHGTLTGTTYVSGKIGGARKFNGTTDKIHINSNMGLGITNITLEAWIYLDSTSKKGTIMNIGGSSNGYAIGVGNTIFEETGNNLIVLFDMVRWIRPNYQLGTGWKHVVLTINSNSKPTIYVNGTPIYSDTGTNPLPPSNYAAIGYAGDTGGSSDPGRPFNGIIDNMRVSNIARTPEEIRQAYEMGRRSHPIIVDFKADLQSSDLITNSNDLSFTIDETPYGTTNTIENIDKEEKIIIKENYNGTEYIAQGDIKTVNKNTGAITVDSWDTESTFPSNGFSENATVFKWQREYIDTRYLLPEDKDSISQLTFRKTTGEPATFWIDDMKKAKYLTDSSGDTFEKIEGVTNVQYRPIFTTWDETVSSNFYLTSVSLDYNSLPLPPTDLLVEGQTNPSSLYPFGLGFKFSAIFNDDNILDTAEEYHIQVNTKNDWTGTMMWDSGWTEMTSTAVGNRSPDITYDGNTLSNATTYYWRIKFKDNYGGEGAWSTETAYFTTDSPPSAPTNLLTERRTNPDNIKTTNPIFSAIYNDPDQDDTSSYYEIHVNTQSNFQGNTMWESGKTLMKTTKQGKRSPDITYQGDPLNMNEVTYYWRIRFWDSTEQIGEWSQVAYFTTYNTPPDAPTDLLTDGEFNPPKITGLTPAFTAVFNDPDGKDTGENYRIQVHTQETFTGGTLMWDSGKKSMNSTARGKRSPDIIYNGTGLSFNATKYYWRIKFWDNYDNEGEWSETAHFTMSGPPFTPTQLKVDGRTNPPDILSINPQFSALFTDPNDDKGTHYRIQVHTQATFTGNTLMWDSSKQSMNHTPSNAHSPSIPYNGTTLTGTSGAVYYWRIKFWDSDGLESGWSSAGTFIDKITQTSLRFEGVGMEGIKVD